MISLSHNEPSPERRSVGVAHLVGREPARQQPRYWRALVRSAYLLHPQPTGSGAIRRAIYLFRHLWHYPYSRRWLEFLATPMMAPIARENPDLYRKPIRPYVSLNWPKRVKVAAMVHHYEFLARQLGPVVFRQVVSRAGRVLLSFPAKNHDEFTVRLRFDGKFRKEGEATLDLESARHACRIFSLTFVVSPSAHGSPCLVIGAVSGLPAGADKNIIKETAKALHGLRPKAFLLLVLQELARAWGVKALLGVGSQIHTSRHMVYALNRSRRFSIAYDEFWREAGGTPRGDGLFSLPLTAPVRDLQTVETHKRSQYRQRQELVGSLLAGLRAFLADWPADPGRLLVPAGVPAAPASAGLPAKAKWIASPASSHLALVASSPDR